MTITCGIDWAEQHHDVAVLDHDGQVLARKRIDAGMGGFTELVGLLNDLADGQPAQDVLTVPIAIETDKNLLVVALQAAGFTVYPTNPLAPSWSTSWPRLLAVDLSSAWRRTICGAGRAGSDLIGA